jgi:hypothetical protein
MRYKMDIEEIAESHKELFPNATPESQFWKLEEEIAEFENCENDQQAIKELADIIIVCGGLYRWFPKTARAVASNYVYNMGVFPEEEVNRKWSVNLKRKWVWNGKTYKHEGKDGNE